MKVYRKNSQYNQWWLLIGDQWWYSCEDEHAKIHHWFLESEFIGLTRPFGLYESSPLAFLACTGKTPEQSFKEGRTL